MYVCMYTRTYVCIYVFVYVYGCVCMYICTYVTYICMYVCMHVWCLPVSRDSMPIRILPEDTGYCSVDRKCLNQQAFRSGCCSLWHCSEHTLFRTYTVQNIHCTTASRCLCLIATVGVRTNICTALRCAS